MRFGDFDLFLIEDGPFRLDGGAMFGVVPKVMWERMDPPDEKNRILLHANCLLVKTGSEVVLIDNGLGNKWDEKQAKIFAVEQPRWLLENLKKIGVEPEDVTYMIQSHLHFDHNGGGTYRDADGNLKLTFPNAKYVVQKGEWEVAQDPAMRDRASYLPENLQPVADSGKLVLVDGDKEILPGIRMRVTGGHTKHHAIIYVESGGHTAVFNADLIPTASHLHIPFVMGYDLYAADTMNFKEHYLPEAFDGHYLMIFEHGPALKAGQIRKNDKGKWVVNKVDMNQEVYEG